MVNEDDTIITEKRKILDEIFENDKEGKFNANFVMPVLCVQPAMVFQYATDWSENLESRFEKDRRMSKIFKKDPNDPNGITPTEIKKFIYDHIEDINCKKLITLMYYNYVDQLSKEVEYGAIPSSKILKDGINKKIDYLTNKYIKKGENIECIGLKKSDDGEAIISIINSDEIFYNKRSKMSPKFADLSKDEIDFINQFIEPVDFNTICSSKELGKKIELSILENNEYGKEDKKELTNKFLNQDTVKNRISTDKYYLMGAQRLANSLDHITEYYMFDENKNLKIDYLINILYLLDKLKENIKKYDNESKIDYDEKTYTANEILKNISNAEEKDIQEFTNKFPEKAYKLCLEGYIQKEQTIELLKSVKKKEELLAYAYKNGTFSKEEIKKILEENKNINGEDFRKQAIKCMIGLDGNLKTYDDTEKYNKLLIYDEKFYELLDSKEKILASNFFLSNFKNSKDNRNKFYFILKNGDTSLDIVKSAFLSDKISDSDLKEILDFIKDNNLEDKYNISELEYNPSTLASSYKKIKSLFINQVLKANGIDDEENEKLTEEEELDAKGNYEFQKKLLKERNLPNNENEINKFIEQLGYFGMTNEGIADIYYEGLISFEILKKNVEREYLRDMINKGLVRDEDIPNDFHNNIEILRKLLKTKKITTKDIILEYTDGKVSENVFNAFAESIDMSNEVNKEEVLKLFKAALPSGKSEKDKIEKFKKYFKIYSKFSKDKISIEELDKLEAQTISKSCYGNADNYKDFYQNGLIGGETLAYAPNEIIAELLKEDSISSIDMQKIFRDTSKDEKFKKTYRLEDIFMRYFRTSKNKSKEENDQIATNREDILLNIYVSAEGEISDLQSELNNIFYNYFIKNGYGNVKEDNKNKNPGNGADTGNGKNPDNGLDTGNEKPQSLMPLIERLSFLKGIDPNAKIKSYGSAYIFYLKLEGDGEKIIIEPIGTRKREKKIIKVNTDITDHATYCINRDVFDEYKERILCKNEGITNENWSEIIQLYKKRIPGVQRAIHNGKSWRNTVEKLLGKSTEEKKRNGRGEK